MELRDKEVYFETWCPKCEYYALDESEDPCDECLNNPVNQYTHRPVCFKEG